MIFSSKVIQPILCYGIEQLLENGDLKVPLNLQNRFSTVQGRIRVIRDEDESCLEAQVPEALEKAAGWTFNQRGLLVGSLLISTFVDPIVAPEVKESLESLELMRTTLVKRGGRWLMPEYCESMMNKEELDEHFFDDDAVSPSVTIFSYEPVPPEDMGFFAPGYKKKESRKWSRQSRRLPLLYSTGDGVEDNKRKREMKALNVNYN